MYYMRLFIFFSFKNYIVYYNVYCYYCGAFIEKHDIVYTKFRLDWILCTWPYNIMSLS